MFSFDSVNHEWLLRMLSHRIADPRVLRLIRQWLRAGVMERGEWKDAVEGTPQGAGISPLLATVLVPSRFMLELTGASSGDMRLSDHAARSMI